MDREVQFETKAKCDICGKEGAHDFMGDYVCDECIEKSGHNGIMAIIDDLQQARDNLDHLFQHSNIYGQEKIVRDLNFILIKIMNAVQRLCELHLEVKV